MVLTYGSGLGSGNVRADWVVVLNDALTGEPVRLLFIGLQLRIGVTDVFGVGIAVGASGHRLEIIHALFRAPVGSGEAEDGRKDRLAHVSVGAPDLQGAQLRP